MKKLSNHYSAFAAVALLALTGCLTEDSEDIPDESCAIPPVSASEACQMRGGRLVTDEDGLALHEEIREIEYQSGGDCGEGRATAACIFDTEICRESGALQDPCGAAGLEAIDAALCDVMDSLVTVQTQAAREAGGVEEETEQGPEERASQRQAEDLDELCSDSFGPDGDQEVGCVEPPESQVMCRSITIDVGCGATREILCRVPDVERPCTDIYAPVCGVDGVTYANECYAGSTPIDHDGECASEVCPLIYAPVCGVDGVTYDNHCMSGDVPILHDGECDGSITGSIDCFEAGLLNQDSVFEVTAQFLEPEDGAWIDEEGNLHTVDQELKTEITVLYELLANDSSWLRESETDNSIVIAPNSLEILHAPFFDGESEAESIFNASWVDYFETNELSDGTTVHLDGHNEGVFVSRLSLFVDGQLCFIESSAELFLDQPLPEPGPEPEPPHTPEPEPQPLPEPPPAD